MQFELDCGSCGYAEIVEAEVESYAMAREHELENPDHFVYIFEIHDECAA